MIHLLLFDVDGTLILTGGAGIRAFQRTFRELFQMDPVIDGIRLHGRTDPQIIDDIFVAGLGRPATSSEIEAISRLYLAHLDDEVRRSPEYRFR